MADGKKSFLLYCDIQSTINKLSDEQSGKLFKIILGYVNDQNPIVEDVLLDLVFEPIKQQLKRDLKRYESIVEKRSLAGLASADKRKQLQQVSTSVESVQQVSTNPTDIENVNVTDNVIDTDIVKEIKEDKEPKPLKRFVKPTILEISEYCQERGNDVNATKFFNFYESKGWKVGKNPMKDWKASVRTWETKNNKPSEAIASKDRICYFKSKYSGQGCEIKDTYSRYEREVKQCGQENVTFIRYAD